MLASLSLMILEAKLSLAQPPLSMIIYQQLNSVLQILEVFGFI